MPTYEHSGVFSYKDENNNSHLLYPVTRKDNVEGMEEIDQHVASKNNPHGVTAAQAGALPVNGTAASAKTLAATVIPENADLNDYVTPGWYQCTVNDAAKTLENCPTNEAFSLEVVPSSKSAAGNKGVIQRIASYRPPNVQIWCRNIHGTAASMGSAEAAYGEWVQVYTTANKPTLDDITPKNAGAHNAIFRGKFLGSSVTAAQYAAITAGTFDDLFIGDYWAIDGVNYRIAAFDYYLYKGEPKCTTHHVVIVPDTPLYVHKMNDSSVTTGGYHGSKMYTEGLTKAKNTITSAFGAAHILTHRKMLTNAVTDGYASAVSWYDSTVELMNEINVYGHEVFTNILHGANLPIKHTIDNGQFPLFAYAPEFINCELKSWWLRDVVSATYFAVVYFDGRGFYASASSAHHVRPAFCIS